MKAVFQHTMFSLLCLASVVLAAPQPSDAPPVEQIPVMTAPKWYNEEPKNAPIAVTDCKSTCEPSVLRDDSADFLYW